MPMLFSSAFYRPARTLSRSWRLRAAAGFLLTAPAGEAAPETARPPSRRRGAPEAETARPARPAPVAAPLPQGGFTNTLGMKFMPVPATRIYLCVHETRSRDFAAFLADPASGYQMTGPDAAAWRTFESKSVPVGRGAGEAAEKSSHPACHVSWRDAMAFCAWLSRKEGKNYRLPTDAEWSAAAALREGAGTPDVLDSKVPGIYPWDGKMEAAAITGNYSDTASKAKFPVAEPIPGYTDGFATTAPVMSFRTNRYGFYDLGGNVYEWCLGCYNGSDPEGRNPALPNARVLRGGSWDDSDPAVLLSSFRYYGDPGARTPLSGFRLAVTSGAP